MIFGMAAQAGPMPVASPDGSIRLAVASDGSTLSLSRKGEQILALSHGHPDRHCRQPGLHRPPHVADRQRVKLAVDSFAKDDQGLMIGIIASEFRAIINKPAPASTGG